MTALIPGQVIRFSEKDKQALAKETAEMTLDLEDESRPLFEALKIWWNNYEAKPRSATKDTPFKGSSNVVIPLIKLMSDSLQARSMSSLFGAGRRIWGVQSENEGDLQTRVAQNVGRHLNWAAWGNEFNFPSLMHDATGEMYPIGSTVTAINYRKDIRPMFFGRGSTTKIPRHDLVEVRRGVQFEHVPRESILWDTRFEIGDAPIVVREHQYSYSTLKRMAQLDPAWDKKAIEKLKGVGKTAMTAADEVRRLKAQHDGRKEDRLWGHPDPTSVYEIHVDWPIAAGLGVQVPGKEDIGAPDLPLVLHIHRQSGALLRAVAEPYHLPHKPFFDLFFRKRSGRGHSIGVAKVLEQLQLIMTTLYNQAIDSRTRSNALWGKTTNAKFSRTPIDPTRPILLSNMAEFDTLNLQTSEFSDLGLINAANTVAERVIGISDPGMGRETRHGGHPSPATSTLALLEQSSIMSSATDLLLRERVSKMGQAWAILTQQFETNEDGRLQRVFGDRDAKDLESYLFPTGPIPGNFHFDIVAMSGSLNPDTEMRRAVTVGQMNANYWAFVLQGAQVLESPQVGPLVQGTWVQAIQSTTKLYNKFLNAANVDDMEAFSARLAELGKNGIEGAQQLAGGVEGLASGQGLAPATGPAGSLGPNAANGAAGPGLPVGQLAQ